MGLPSPHYDIDLLTSDGQPAKAGEQGEIVIRTNRAYPIGLFNGYYRNETLTNEVWLDNTYYTGDALVKKNQEHVKTVTAPYKYPRIIEFVEELPSTISGKIRRMEIRERDNH